MPIKFNEINDILGLFVARICKMTVCKKALTVFLSRVSVLPRDIDIAILFVRPSVRHVLVVYRNVFIVSSPHGSLIILVL